VLENASVWRSGETAAATELRDPSLKVVEYVLCHGYLSGQLLVLVAGI